MKKHQLIKSVKIKTEQNNPVLLLEQQIYKEGTNKFLLLKLLNNNENVLKSFKFEITKYDNFDNVLSKSYYEVKDYSVLGNNEFILEQKILIDNELNNYTFDLLEATYDNNTWIDGFWINEITEEKNDKEEVSESLIKEESGIKYINVKFKKFPILIPIFLVSIIIFMFALNINKTYQLTEEQDNFLYTVYNGEAYVYDYLGSDLDLVIPEFINGIRVRGVYNGSFRYSLFVSVTFMGGNSEVGAGAFSNSPLLAEINAYGFRKIEEGAFSNLPRLRNVNSTSYNTISPYAFYNTKRLERFKFAYNSDFDFELRNLTKEERPDIK